MVARGGSGFMVAWHLPAGLAGRTAGAGALEAAAACAIWGASTNTPNEIRTLTSLVHMP